MKNPIKVNKIIQIEFTHKYLENQSYRLQILLNRNLKKFCFCCCLYWTLSAEKSSWLHVLPHFK